MTRFVILGHPRCGSFLLLHALNQHPRVRCFSELFLRDEPTRIRSHTLDGGRAYDDREDGASFLRELVFVPRGERDVIGFKLFYDQAAWAPASSAWDLLAADRELRVIHLERARLLESLVSFRVAQRTDEWMLHRLDGVAPAQLAPFELSPDECQKYFDKMIDGRRRARERLSGHACLEVDYETLCARFDETLAACFRHLGLPPCPVEKELVKQATRPVREQVANYAELERRFAGTPYARYL